MAGAGYKNFTAGNILRASEVNTYLMQQSVMVFATTTARSTAITSPSNGMLTYITATKTIELYDGAWTQIGGGNNATYPNQAVITSPGGTARPLPFSFTAGSASITGSGTITIGSSGRFTQNPIVTLGLVSSAGNRSSATWATTGTPLTTITAYVWNGTVAATASATVQFHAVQMTSASASNV